jgi:hypothetical protein
MVIFRLSCGEPQGNDLSQSSLLLSATKAGGLFARPQRYSVFAEAPR